jgi:pimeloyl-ACP methyl ester carboxylesterase
MSKVISPDGTHIGFSRVGSGPALILIDGAMCFREFGPLEPLATRLASDFTVYTYDRRGRGESGDTMPYAVDRELDDLAAVIGETGGGAAVYGVSSGAILALLGVRRGLHISRLGLFEPPIAADAESTARRQLVDELAKLIAHGRRGDAVEHFQTAIGIPPEMVAGMRNAPSRPVLESIAHTLVYDTTVTVTISSSDLPAIATPALVIDSGSTSSDLAASTAAVAHALPAGAHASLPGQFHDVPADALAPVLADFMRG